MNTHASFKPNLLQGVRVARAAAALGAHPQFLAWFTLLTKSILEQTLQSLVLEGFQEAIGEKWRKNICLHV